MPGWYVCAKLGCMITCKLYLLQGCIFIQIKQTGNNKAFTVFFNESKWHVGHVHGDICWFYLIDIGCVTSLYKTSLCRDFIFFLLFFFLIDVMTSEMHFRIQVSVLDGRLSEQDGKHCLLQWLTGSLEFWKYYKKNCDKLNVFHLKSSYNEKIDSLTHSLVSLCCRSIWAAAASCSLHAT